ncbi:MAG: DUF3306 domain-containing protein [Pseudomonadota bacterium]
MSRDEGFLGRWSRLKQTPEARSADPTHAPPEPSEPTAASPDERTDEEILSDLGLPDPQDLKPGDDIAGFMRREVPAKLRRLALRQLWRGNPVLANVDELVEYGEDYTDSATVVENLQTLYQVGKGMFRELDEPKEAEALATAAEDPPDPPAEQATEPQIEPSPPEDNPAYIVADTSGGEPVGALPEALEQPSRRRMHFS